MNHDDRGRRVFVPTFSDTDGPGRPRFRDFPAALLGGSSENFDVFYDGTLGERGRVISTSVLQRLERDLTSIGRYFEGITLPRFNIVLGRLPEDERAYHYGSNGTDLFCDVSTTPKLSPRYSSFLAVALLVEVFASYQEKGWDSGTHSGEALSRVIAASIYPGQIPGFATGGAWLDTDRKDYVNRTIHTDRDPVATGCGTLFLNYLHHQLGFGWSEIVKAGAETLRSTYETLTGDPEDPFGTFRELLDSRFPSDRPADISTDNPFPLGGGDVHEPLFSFRLVGPGVPTTAGRPSRLMDKPVDLDSTLGNRRWVYRETPFSHVRVSSVFTPEAYYQMVDQFHEMFDGGQFAKDIPGYDVDAAAITSENSGAFSVFTSRLWNDLWARIFSVEVTGDLNVTLHHHRIGSASGVPHNDLNPGWVVPENRPDGISVHDPQTCDYKFGTSENGIAGVERVRAIALIYYLANPPYRPGQGGATGLYRAHTDPVDRPSVAIAPENNSLVAFACTPFSYHSFITNDSVERNCLVMWLHQTIEEVERKWGAESIVRW